MAGYHRCEHCKEWHDCAGKPKESADGCFAALLLLVVLALIGIPAGRLAVEFWENQSCEKWPNWAQGCSVNKNMFYNKDRDLDERLKRLEEKK